MPEPRAGRGRRAAFALVAGVIGAVATGSVQSLAQSPVAASAPRRQAAACTPIPAGKIAFQLATVMGGFMPPGATPLPHPDPARMRAGTANPPLPQMPPRVDDFEKFLRAMHRIGFRNMERFGGSLLLPDQRYRAAVRGAGIRVVSSHGSLEQPEWDEELRRARALRQDYVGSWGFGPYGFDSYDHVLQTAANLDRLGREARARGMGFIVHDHEASLWFRYPYDRNGDGHAELLTAWEIVAARTNPRFVQFELDLHWALRALGSEDALVAFLERNHGRIALLHVKGTAPDGSVTDLGQGTENWPRIFRAAGSGVRYYVWEYERPADPLRSAAIAYAALRCRTPAGAQGGTAHAAQLLQVNRAAVAAGEAAK